MKRKRLVTVIGIICLALILVATSVMMACAPKEPEQIVLKMSFWTAPGSPFANASVWPLREVEQRTNGKVKFEEYYLGTLVPCSEEIPGIGQGIADLSTLFCPLNRENALLAGIVTCPGVPKVTGDVVKDSLSMAVNMDKLARTSEEIQADFERKNLMLLWAQGGMPRSLLSAKIKFTSVDDFKGRTTRAAGDEAKIVQSFGGAAVGLTSAEEYEGLALGICDFCIDNPCGAIPWKLEEVTDYWIPMVIGYATFFTIMNLDTWNELPKDVQQVFADVAAIYPEKFTEIYAEGGHPLALKVFADAGAEFLPWPESEQAKIDAAAAPLAKAWAEEREKRGIPAMTVLNQWREIWGREPIR